MRVVGNVTVKPDRQNGTTGGGPGPLLLDAARVEGAAHTATSANMTATFIPRHPMPAWRLFSTTRTSPGRKPVRGRLWCVNGGGRYWTRTSDFLGVSEAL